MGQVNVNQPEPRPPESRMGQVNVNQPESRPPVSRPPRDESASAAATRNLTWAIAAVIVIAALAIAVVYVVNSIHGF